MPHFYADPCTILSMDELEAMPAKKWFAGAGFVETDGDRPAAPLPGDTRGESRKMLERPQPHILNALSPELQYEILSHLPFDELLNMKLVCRDLARLAASDMLPRSYWSSRFLLGQEADFLFPSLNDTQD